MPDYIIHLFWLCLH